MSVLPVFVTVADLTPFADVDPSKATAMIEDATATALMHAPNLAGELPVWKVAAVKAILRGAILRWAADLDNGAVSSRSTADGPFSQSVSYDSRRGMFYPSEIDQLKQLGRGAEEGKAFTLDLVPASGGAHDLICSANWGAPCSCGADIAGEPIYGVTG